MKQLYKTVKTESIKSLDRQVHEAIRDGYIPLGTVVIGPSGNSYFQSMVHGDVYQAHVGEEIAMIRDYLWQTKDALKVLAERS